MMIQSVAAHQVRGQKPQPKKCTSALSDERLARQPAMISTRRQRVARPVGMLASHRSPPSLEHSLLWSPSGWMRRHRTQRWRKPLVVILRQEAGVLRVPASSRTPPIRNRTIPGDRLLRPGRRRQFQSYPRIRERKATPRIDSRKPVGSQAGLANRRLRRVDRGGIDAVPTHRDRPRARRRSRR